MTRRTGLLPDSGRYTANSSHALRSRLRGTPRGFADLSQYAHSVLDQNEVGSCVACGVGSAAATTLAAAGKSLAFVPSTLLTYQLALRLDRAADNPLKPAKRMPALRDVGTELLTGVHVLSRYGVGPMGPRVIVGGTVRECDCGPYNATHEDAIALADAIVARTSLLVGAYEIHGADARDLMALALDSGHSLAIGGFVDSAYMAYTARDNPIGAQDLRDTSGGGHCTELLGYCGDGAGRVWRIKGSWGTSWGDAGFGWVNDQFVEQLWSVYCLSVVRA